MRLYMYGVLCALFSGLFFQTDVMSMRLHCCQYFKKLEKRKSKIQLKIFDAKSQILISDIKSNDVFNLKGNANVFINQ